MHPILHEVPRFLLVTIAALLFPPLIIWAGLSGYFLSACNADASPIEWAFVIIILLPAVWPPIFFIWFMISLLLGIWFWHISRSALVSRWFTLWTGAPLAVFFVVLIAGKIAGASDSCRFNLF